MSMQCDTCAFNQDTPMCLQFLIDQKFQQIFDPNRPPLVCENFLEQLIEECDLDVSALL